MLVKMILFSALSIAALASPFAMSAPCDGERAALAPFEAQIAQMEAQKAEQLAKRNYIGNTAAVIITRNINIVRRRAEGQTAALNNCLAATKAAEEAAKKTAEEKATLDNAPVACTPEKNKVVESKAKVDKFQSQIAERSGG